MNGKRVGAMSAATVRELAGARGLELSEAQVADVRSFQESMAPDVDRLRSIPLHFVGDLRLPSDAFAWIENYPEIDPESARARVGDSTDEGGRR